jgi:hypothetical protein
MMVCLPAAQQMIADPHWLCHDSARHRGTAVYNQTSRREPMASHVEVYVA